VSVLSAALTPWYRRTSTSAGDGPPVSGSLSPTAILDFDSPEVQRLVSRARRAARSSSPLEVLETAHAIIRDEVRPVYALDESTPSSRTLRRGKGSCSQRLAILESGARAVGVPTRVRALRVDRSFWYPRFPRIKFFLPEQIMLVWPEFTIDGTWRSETLFEAVGRCAIDWDGSSDNDEYDLSKFVRADLGYFSDRDAAFDRFGQTLAPPILVLADPVLRRISA